MSRVLLALVAALFAIALAVRTSMNNALEDEGGEADATTTATTTAATVVQNLQQDLQRGRALLQAHGFCNSPWSTIPGVGHDSQGVQPELSDRPKRSPDCGDSYGASSGDICKASCKGDTVADAKTEEWKCIGDDKWELVGEPVVCSSSAVNTNVSLPTPLSLQQRMQGRASLWSFLPGMLKMSGKSYTDTFCSRSNEKDSEKPDYCKTVDGYPGSNSHSELKFDKIVEDLMTVPAREESGDIRRLGDLGYFIFNDVLWAKDWKVFPIGADFEDHRMARPVADILMGKQNRKNPAWTTDMIRKSAKEFFQGRKTIETADYSAWVTKLFHKILLDVTLDETQVAEFESYKANSMLVSMIPIKKLAELADWKFGTTAKRDKLLASYVKAMDEDKRGLIPKKEELVVSIEAEKMREVVVDGKIMVSQQSLESEQIRAQRFVADLLLTTMTSAGGLSLPTTIGLVLGVIYGGENSPWAQRKKLAELSKTEITLLVYETLRRFPVVVGFPMWSPDVQKRTVLNVAMGLRDPDVWEEPLEFRLRKLTEYHQKAGSGTNIGLAWAQQAKGPNGLTADSRGCPGQGLTMVIIEQFLLEMKEQESHKSGQEKEWSVSKQKKGGVQITEGPCGVNAFTLSLGTPVVPEDNKAEDKTTELTMWDAMFGTQE